MPAAPLEIAGLSAGYGPTRVLEDVGFSVAAGGRLAVLGRNGMGKTTLLATIAGQTRRYGGAVLLDGQDIGGISGSARALKGLGYVPQGRCIFKSLTVEENLFVGLKGRRRDAMEEAYALFPRLAERRRNLGSQLSGGEQQMLAIGRALMARPKLILMDEPSMGLSPLLVKEVFGIIGKLNRDLGITILLVEQNARMALQAASYGYIMENGKVVLDGAAEALRDNEDVKEFYLGGGGEARKSFKNLKSFKRRKRWL